MRTRLNHFVALTALVAAGLVVAASAKADLTNGSFESNFSGWSTTGNTSIQTAAFGAQGMQSNGAVDAFLYTGAASGTSGSFNAVSTASIVSFFGSPVTAALFPNAFNGSAIKQTFTANAGSVSFDFNWLSNEPNVDAAYAILINNSTNAITIQTLSANITATSNATNFDIVGLETGKLSSSFTLGSAGSYTLGFVVVNNIDGTVQSGLLVDNIVAPAFTGGGGGGSAIPLPASMWVGPLGLLVAAGFALRLRRNAAC